MLTYTWLACIAFFVLVSIAPDRTDPQHTAHMVQAPLSRSVPSAKQAISPQQITPTPVDAQVLVLQAQLEQMRQTDSMLVDTIIWSLATLVTITVAIIFYNGFAVSRNYERDKRAIKEELRFSMRASIYTTVEEVVKRDTRKVRRIVERNSSDIAELKYRALQDKAQEEEAKGHYRETLQYYMDMLQLQPMLINKDNLINDVLIAVMRMLAMYDITFLSEVTKMLHDLNELPPQFNTSKERIQQILISRVSTFTTKESPADSKRVIGSDSNTSF